MTNTMPVGNSPAADEKVLSGYYTPSTPTKQPHHYHESATTAHEQPGLEAIEPPQGLQVVAAEDPNNRQPGPEVYYHYDHYYAGKEAVPPHHILHAQTQRGFADNPIHRTDSNLPEVVVIQGGEKKPGEKQIPWRKRHRRLWFLLLAGIALVVVIIGAVVGGVVGSRSTRESGDLAVDEQQETTTTTTTTPPKNEEETKGSNKTSTALNPPKTIKPGSPLAVTGWRGPKGIEIFLYYQDPENELRQSRYDGSKGTPSVNHTAKLWTAEGEEFDSFSDSETSGLAATIILAGEAFDGQVELFYGSSQARVHGNNYKASITPPFQQDSIVEKSYPMGLGSRVAAYWPFLVYQEADGKLTRIINNPYGMQPMSFWERNDLRVNDALKQTGLALVPTSANFTKVAMEDEYTIVYQREGDGRLVGVVMAAEKENERRSNSWPDDRGFLPPTDLPQNTPFAAFAVARPGDRRQSVEIFVVYMDKSGNFNVITTEGSVSDNSGDMKPKWSAPRSPEAFKDADPNTDIACLTLATSFNDVDGNEVRLEPRSTEARCYFQVYGRVREVMLDGQEWVVLGNVPTP